MSNNADIQAIYDSRPISQTLKLRRMKAILQYECEIKILTIWTYFDSNYDIIKNVYNKNDLIDYIKPLISKEYLIVIYRCNMVFEFKYTKNNMYITEHSYDPFNESNQFILQLSKSSVHNYKTTDEDLSPSFNKMKYILTWESRFSRISGTYFDINGDIIKSVLEIDELYAYIRASPMDGMYTIVYNYKCIMIFCLATNNNIYVKFQRLNPFDNNSYREYNCSPSDIENMKNIGHSTYKDIHIKKKSFIKKLISYIA